MLIFPDHTTNLDLVAVHVLVVVLVRDHAAAVILVAEADLVLTAKVPVGGLDHVQRANQDPVPNLNR